MEILSVTFLKKHHIFNEDPPYITHFVVFHPFLRGPQILLTFIRHLILTKSNLSKKKLAFFLNRVSNNSMFFVHIANRFVFTL